MFDPSAPDLILLATHGISVAGTEIEPKNVKKCDGEGRLLKIHTASWIAAGVQTASL
jgi:hypothetical protein